VSLRRHCTLTGVRNVKQVSFKPGPEDCYRRCGSDKTVTDTCSGDRESSVTNSKESGAADNEDELERSRWRASTSATWQSSSVRYAGADQCRHLYMRTACLKAIRSGAFSQCSWRRSGVHHWLQPWQEMWWNASECRIAFVQPRADGRDDTSDWRTDIDTDRRIVRSWRSTE